MRRLYLNAVNEATPGLNWEKKQPKANGSLRERQWMKQFRESLFFSQLLS